MKEILLSTGGMVFVDDEDFEILNSHRWYCRKGGNKFYAGRANGKRGIFLMHRVILNVTDPNVFVDHIDGDGLNNQRSNLRIATKMQNAYNMGSNKNTSSRFKGVCWKKKNKVWTAQISANKITKHIGCYKSEIEAAIAYNEASKKLHGEFALLNQIEIL